MEFRFSNQNHINEVSLLQEMLYSYGHTTNNFIYGMQMILAEGKTKNQKVNEFKPL